MYSISKSTFWKYYTLFLTFSKINRCNHLDNALLSRITSQQIHISVFHGLTSSCLSQEDYTEGPVGVASPMMFYGGMSIFAGLLNICLPETRGKPMPETVEDLKNDLRYDANGCSVGVVNIKLSKMYLLRMCWIKSFTRFVILKHLRELIQHQTGARKNHLD